MDRDSLDSGDDQKADWLDKSIKQNVSLWKQAAAYHARPQGEKVATWIDQEY